MRPMQSLPFPYESFDVDACVYLFHELPEQARLRAASEMVRVSQAWRLGGPDRLSLQLEDFRLMTYP